jgi:hypothetical protein
MPGRSLHRSAPRRDQPGGTPGVNTVVGGTQAFAVLIVYVAVLAVVAGLALQRQDAT